MHWILKNPKLKFANFSNLEFGIFKLQNWSLPTFQTWSLEFSNSTKFENSQTSSLFGRFPNKLPKFGHSANKHKREMCVWELANFKFANLKFANFKFGNFANKHQTQTQTSRSLQTSNLKLKFEILPECWFKQRFGGRGSSNFKFECMNSPDWCPSSATAKPIIAHQQGSDTTTPLRERRAGPRPACGQTPLLVVASQWIILYNYKL